ncbi:MAG: M23 family metallopeptidase [Bacteroidales bacterium]|nr:M23 family metallopeptidase [Bacteroidales bacterium]MCB8999761.1 M23 family metallopeptidase [Bacteroidales bacterium]MCB9013428.1 M23 family metallopeptidase [Bacteroidales bacterium]
MPRVHFKYDPENLKYLKLNHNLRSRLFKSFSWIAGSLVLAIMFNILYAIFFDTPRESQARQENEALLQDYQFLSKKYNRVDTVLKEVRSIDENLYRTIFETEPVFRKGLDENEELNELFQYLSMTNNELVSLSHKELENIHENISLQEQEYRHLMSYSGEKSELLTSLPAIQPIRNKDLTRTASGFGYRIHPIYKIKKMHPGMDFTAPTGTEVFATGDGTVELVEMSKRGNGNTIVLDHGSGYKTSYMHLDATKVRTGNKVKRGDVIGWVGNTGLSVAPHLHYEVSLNGNPVNPVNYFFLELSPENYDKMILLSIKSGQSFD